uniref:Uncharacterized protein n=1 Tax=Meloidogyne enterolobii TaxID=390850 RepID=A0A6V7TJ19_MELEN|nr:unnamed protein product [Meloidogyne enterolobii]
MLKITFFTFVLIRDKRTIFLDLLHAELLGNEWNNSTNMRERNPLIMIRRSSLLNSSEHQQLRLFAAKCLARLVLALLMEEGLLGVFLHQHIVLRLMRRGS